MTEFIFRFPANTPDLDFSTLDRLMAAMCDQAGCTSCSIPVGTTVKIRRSSSRRNPAYELTLYDTPIARISPYEVIFSAKDDPHKATSEWIAKIVRDNAIGDGVGRIRRHVSDGPGPETSRYSRDGKGPQRAGLLVIDWDRSRPVFGQAYPVGDIKARRVRLAEVRERIRKAREEASAQVSARTRLEDARWEADRLRRAMSGDDQATQDLEELAMLRTGAAASNRLAELELVLTGTTTEQETR